MNILLRKTARDLRASLAQTGALVFIVALGIATFIALAGAYRDLSTSYNSTYDRLKFADVAFSVQAAPESVVTAVAQVPGVESAAGRLVVDTGFQLPNGEQIRSRLIGLPPGQHPSVNDVLVTEGRYLSPANTREVLVEKHFADIYGVRPGGTVSPIINGKKVDFTVAGVVASPEYLIVTPSREDFLPSARTFAVLFVSMPELEELAPLQPLHPQAGAGQAGGAGQGATTGSTGNSAGGAVYINDVGVRFAPGADPKKAQDDINAVLAPYGVTAVTPRSAQPSNEGLSLDLDGYRELSTLMPGLILIVSAIAMYVMLGRTVRAQQPQIGVMKAVGYGNGAIMAHYFTFGLLIVLAGALIGIPGGLLLAGLVTGAYAAELGIPLVESRFYPDLVGIATGLSLLFSLLACAGPSRAATRMAPADAMRMDPSVALVRGQISWVERVLQRLVHPSIWVRLPLRNVFRVRARSLSTGLGILLAFVLVLVVWGMFDSMSYLLSHNFNDVERWDEAVTFSAPQQQSTLDQVKGWPGVRQVEPIIQLPVSVEASGRSEDAFLTAFDPAQKMHVLQLSGGNAQGALSGDQIVLTPGLARRLNLSTGDALQVSTPLGKASLTLGGTSDELSGGSAYMSTEAALKLAGEPAASSAVFNGLYLTVDPARAQAIKSELFHLPGAASVRLKSEVQSDWGSLMGLFYAFMGAVLAFAVAMAFALLFNAMTVNVLERAREFATMRAVGMGGGPITWQLMVENVVMWVVVLIPGILLGSWVAAQMGAAFSSNLMEFRVVIAPGSYLLASVGILVTMELAALPAIRRINRLNLAEATKTLA